MTYLPYIGSPPRLSPEDDAFYSALPEALESPLLDGRPPGCVCTSACPFPCFQRPGLDMAPCCKGCAPLAWQDDPDPLVAEEHQRSQRRGGRRRRSEP